MKSATFVLVFVIFLTASHSCQPEKKLDNTFYCFNNCVRTLPNAPETIPEQVGLIKRLGFDGFAGHISQDYFSLRSALDTAGLKMPEIYWGCNLDSAGNFSYKEGLREVIRDSKDRDLIVSLYTDAKPWMENREAGDALLVEGIRELAGFAAPYHVKIALYPHVNNYVERVEHAIKLAKLIDRENVGIIFNTCHLLKVEGEAGWEQKLLDALPYLLMISINGADSGNTQEMGWDRLIQPLGEGTFDTYRLVKLAKNNGYKGMFGLQCYNIRQDCEIALTRSMNTWKNYRERYASGD